MTKSKKIKVKDEYLNLICDIVYDYDGCNTIDSLKELIDEIVEYANKAINCRIDTVEFLGGNGKQYNILHEEIG